MSDAVYRCRSCKTRVSLGMPICPICGEPITPQSALLSAGSSAPAKVVMRHNTAAYAPAASAPAASAPQPQATSIPQQTWAEIVAEMATPTPESVARVAAHAYPAPPTRARGAGRSFAVYVACVVMVLVGSFLIGIGLARRYTANEQAAQNLSAPGKVIVVQPSAGVGGPLLIETGEKTK